MTETFEPFQVTVKAQPRPMAYGTLPTSPQPTPPSVMWYNVKTMYGADNSGNIDSTQVIQNAINAANTAGGGVVYFPPGTYRISAALIVYGGSQLRGDGDANTIIRQYTPNVGCFTGTDMYQFKLSNIQLLGTGAGTGKGIFFKLGSYSNTGFLHFEDVFIQKFGGDAIDIDTPQSSVFDRVITQGNGGNGWNTHSGTVATSCTWNACFSKGNGAAGFTHTNLSYSSMNGCSSTGNRTAYILTNCQSVVLDSPGADSNVGDNFIISGGVGNVLIAPRVFQNNGYGIHLTNNAKNCVIVGAYDNSPLAGVTNFIATDAGTSCTIINVNNTTANLYNGSVNILDDGSGNVTTPGLLTAGGVDTTALSTASVSKTAAYTLTLNDNVVLCNATSGAFTVTLPNSTAASVKGTIFLIKKTDVSANAVTLAAVGGQTIDGMATATLTTRYAFVAVQSDGANWQIVGGASSTSVAGGTTGWYNVRLFGADYTGAADSTTAIQNAINTAGAAGGGVVYFPAGSYVITATLNIVNLNNVTLLGDGQASFIKPTNSFGGQWMNVTGGNGITFRDLIIQWPSTTTANNGNGHGWYVNHSNNFHVDNVTVMYQNGWTLLIYSDATGDSLYPIVNDLHTVNCNGGLVCTGTNSTDHLMGLYADNCTFDNCLAYPAIQFGDVADAKVINTYGSSASPNYPCINITGACSSIIVSNSKFTLSLPTASQSNGNVQSTSVGIAFSNCIFNKGANCFNILNNSKQVSFSNCEFINALGHGLYVANAVDQITVTGCTFAGNGTSNNSSYDIYAGGTGAIVITGNQFLSPVGTVTGTLVKSIIFNVGAAIYSVCDGNYFAGAQGSSWPAGSPPRTAVGNTGDPYAAIGAIPAWYDVRKYGALGNNSADDTVAIQATINAAAGAYAGGVVYLPHGVYRTSVPLTIGTSGNQLTFMGDGANHSWINPLSTFVGAAAIIVTGGPADYFTIKDLYINGPGWNTAPAFNGINLVDTWNAKVDNVVTSALNGYSVSSFCDTNGANFYTQITRVTSINGRGGIDVHNTTASGGNTASYASISNCVIHQSQVLPGINIQDSVYNDVVNCRVVGNQGPGIQISGVASEVYLTACNIGAWSGTAYPALWICGNAGNFPNLVYAANCFFAGGQYGARVDGGNSYFFTNCAFAWAQFNGLHFSNISGTDTVHVANCQLYANARVAGTYYDLYWAGTGWIDISNCTFATGINPGVAGYATKSINFAAGNSTVHGCLFYVAVGNAFAGTPTWAFGNVGDTMSNFPSVTAQGISGTIAGRFVGATGGGGPPGAGTFARGDMVIDPQGQIYVCTAAGSPGTWTGTGPYTAFVSVNPSYIVPNDNVQHNIVGAAVTINVQPGWEVLVNFSVFGQVFEGNTAAHATLSCGILQDGTVAGTPGMLVGRSGSVGYGGMLANLWKFTGLSSGNHTFQLYSQWNGTASQAAVYQSQISATASRPPM